MLPSKIEPIIRLTAELTNVPYSMVKDITDHQFSTIKDYSQGKLDLPTLDFTRLGRFSISKNSLKKALITIIPKARRNPVYKDKLSRLWKLRKHTLNYERFKSYKSRFGSWHCGRPDDWVFPD